MTELLAKLDPYVRKARLYPALLLTLPIGLTITSMLPEVGVREFMPVAFAAGVPFAIANVVRAQGQRLEARLVRRWGGMPTTRMLRLTDPTNNPDLLARRRRVLEELTSLTLPTADEERRNPGRADRRYVAATRLLISKLGDTRTTHPRVYEELTNYGFWRNSLAIKPYALLSLAVLAAVQVGLAVVAGRDLPSTAFSIAITVLAAVYWTAVVRPQRVRQHGETYASRLLETLDWLTPSTPPAN